LVSVIGFAGGVSVVSASRLGAFTKKHKIGNIIKKDELNIP